MQSTIDVVGHVRVVPPLDEPERADLRQAWRPCASGCCLTLASRASPTPERAAASLREVAAALGSGRVRHRLHGTVVGCCAGDGALFLLSVDGRRVSTRVLRPGGRGTWLPVGAGPTAAAALRRLVVRGRQRRTSGGGRGVVVAFVPRPAVDGVPPR